MRVQIRSLNQDVENVKTGKDLLHTAEGGVQSIVNELRNLKAMALDSANDTNTDIDRATIQKEFSSRMEEINDIAATTNYNGRLLLDGTYFPPKPYQVIVAPDGTTQPTTKPTEPAGAVTLIPTGDYTISNDGIYKLDYNKILEYHIQKRADITVVCKEMPEGEDLSRFGQVKADDDGRIRGYEEKPMIETSRNVSCGIYVIRRRLLIELIERAAEEDRYDLVKDILIRYKNLKKIYGYKIDLHFSQIEKKRG